MKIWKFGLIINPIAGMGGKVGLKGSDGLEILKKAREMGAQPQSSYRARLFLTNLLSLKSNIQFYSINGIMGGDLCMELGFETILLDSAPFSKKTELYSTSATDTRQAAKNLLTLNLDLILFVGGDGTARDICESVNSKVPCLGIPGGVKIHSSVFATNPQAAAELLKEFIKGTTSLRDSEVMDINEDAFRENRVESKLYGFLQTPYLPMYVQPSKMASPHTDKENHNQERIAQYIINQMEQDSDSYYLLGPGTTTRAIANLLNQEKTLLGVDVFFQQKLIATDLNEIQLIELIDKKDSKLIITPIGAQGYVFGRGNLQLSPKVLLKIGLKNIIIIATKFKMSTLPNGKMRVDSREPDFDLKFSGLHRVIVDYGELVIASIE